MQTKRLFVASGIRNLSPDDLALPGACRKGFFMSKTASIALASSSTSFGRLMAFIDRLLMASARISVRNGDLPHFGL
jgi:hypothetical protein